MHALALLLLAVARDDREDLGQAAAKIAEAASYAFKQEMQIESPLGAAGPGIIPAIEGKVEKEVGLLAKVGDVAEIFRKGDRLLIKNGQSEWQAAPAEAQGRRPRGRLMQGLLRQVRQPHEEARDLAKAFKEVRKQEVREKVGEAECAVYAGEMGDEGLKASPLGRMLQQFGAGASITGSARAWVDGEGRLLKIEFTNRASLEIQGNTVDVALVRTLEFSAVGKTTVTVPEAVQKLLESGEER